MKRNQFKPEIALQLTEAIKSEIREDFAAWTGGFSPSDLEEITQYLRCTSPMKYAKIESDLCDWLISEINTDCD
jgi:hypothetical protein